MRTLSHTSCYPGQALWELSLRVVNTAEIRHLRQKREALLEELANHECDEQAEQGACSVYLNGMREVKRIDTAINNLADALV